MGKIYTKTGDDGSTGLFGGPRVSKADLRIESYGTFDELNAILGMARAVELPEDLDQQLGQIQSELFSLGAELATPDPAAFGLRVITASHISRLESWIDEHQQTLAPLKHFILPGGTPAAAHLHLARTVCRRAERCVVRLQQLDSCEPTVRLDPAIVIYLNRLSDLLFVLSRVANLRAGRAEVIWVNPVSE